jgi:hypothetical protein
LKVIEGEKIRYGKKNDFGELAYPGFPSICYSNPNLRRVAWRRRGVFGVTSESVDVEGSEFRIGNKWRITEAMQLLEWP